MTNSLYQQVFDEWLYQGFRLKQVCGYGISDGRFTAIWENESFKWSELQAMDQLIESLMAKHNIPAISVAIGKDGRGVYARAIGDADTDNSESVTVKHRFRIASVSKTITSIGIMKLIDQGQVTLSDKVFGVARPTNKIAGQFLIHNKPKLGTTYGTPPYGPGITDITVQHLLEHTAGGWDNEGGNPMHQDKSWDHNTLISETLDNIPLDNSPGDNYAYSGFGFCLLGRIIEEETGSSYEDWIKENILKPSGANSFEMGGSTLEERKPQEVVLRAKSQCAL